MESKPIRDFVVGLFVLVGLGAVAYLSTRVAGGNYSGPKGLKLYATFGEIGGLKARAPVVIAGVKVGEVTSITLNDKYRARVDLDLDPTLKLMTDCKASIVTAGVLGDRYISLDPGGGEDLVLKSGEEITHTQNAVILERLIDRFIFNADEKGKEKTTQP